MRIRVRTLIIYQFEVIKIKTMHHTDKIVERPVDKGTPRPAVMIIREFIWVVSSPRKVCSIFVVME